jgi:hypothetical protein
MQIKILALALSCGLAGAAVGAGGTWYLTRILSGRVASGIAEPSVHTVSWYQAHPAEIKQKLAACYDNPGGAIHDPDCANADDAQGRIESIQRNLAILPNPSRQ